MGKTYLTADTLIESVKRRISVPINQQTFQDTDILAFADEEMAMGLVPTVLRMHEDYLLYTEGLPLISEKVRYEIPYRAIGNKIREVAFKDNNGNIFEMTRILKEDLPFYNGPGSVSRIYAFYLESNEICLVPENINVATGTMQVSYYFRPNSLVKADEIAVVTNIDTVTGDISVSSIPSAFTTNSLYDFIQFKAPNRTFSYDISPASINTVTNVISFTPADLPTNLAVGDQISLAGETNLIQVPSDLHVMLAHRVATRILEAMGDLENLGAANQKLAELEQQATALIDNRVEGSPAKIVNRHSIIRSGLYSRRYRFRS